MLALAVLAAAAVESELVLAVAVTVAVNVVVAATLADSLTHNSALVHEYDRRHPRTPAVASKRLGVVFCLLLR